VFLRGVGLIGAAVLFCAGSAFAADDSGVRAQLQAQYVILEKASNSSDLTRQNALHR